LSAPVGPSFTESRSLSGAYLLDGLWRRLGIDTAIRTLLTRRRIDEQLAERVIGKFLLRSSDPSSPPRTSPPATSSSWPWNAAGET